MVFVYVNISLNNEVVAKEEASPDFVRIFNSVLLRISSYESPFYVKVLDSKLKYMAPLMTHTPLYDA